MNLYNDKYSFLKQLIPSIYGSFEITASRCVQDASEMQAAEILIEKYFKIFKVYCAI